MRLQDCGKIPVNVGSYGKGQGIVIDEPTLRCHHNPLVGALGIQEPVILGEPQVKG